jgi:hypothetical protein
VLRDGTSGTRLDETCPYKQELLPLHDLGYLDDIGQGFEALPTGMNWTQRDDGKFVYRKTETQVRLAAVQRYRIVTLKGSARGNDRKWPVNDGQIPNFRGVRVHVSTGYNHGEGNRRAS